MSMTLAETALASQRRPAIAVSRSPKLARHLRLNPVPRIVSTLVAALMVMALLVATSAPARADRRSDDIAKALAALAVIGIIANQMNRPAKAAPVYPLPRPVPVAPLVPSV